MGVWDPPGAVPPVNGLFPTTTAVPYTTTSDPPSAVTLVATLPASTAIPNATPIPSNVALPAPSSSSPLAVIATPAPVNVDKGLTSSAPGAAGPTASTGAAVAVASPTIVGTIGGNVVSATPGASTVQIGTQVVTAGGSEVTLPGGNVASLGSSGSLLVKYPSGTTSVYIIPTAAPSNIELMGATWVTSGGSSAVIIGTQTISIGGPAVTLSNHDVISLGPSGLNIQMPGGAVSTLVPANPAAVTGADEHRLASLIAESKIPFAPPPYVIV
jgi:hypothetical protein